MADRCERVDCPTREALLAFSAGNLCDREFEGVAGCIESCAQCQQRLEQLGQADDELMRGLRRDMPKDAPAAEAAIAATETDTQAGMSEQATATMDEPSRRAAMDITNGRFGDYELLTEIARGGMGVVYKARQVKLNRVVALKMIVSGQLASEEQIRRFYIEAEAAANLDHPGIVPVFEVGQHRGQHYYSMGFVEGSSLAGRLADGPLPPREAAELMVKSARAVAYAHERGVIHRDLKPSNILIDARGQPRVTDFGLAKRVETDSELTATGGVLGTPSYMAPEQAAGRTQAVGPLADVYSLGATLYCLLTGRPPFQAASVAETLKQVMEQEPVSPRRLNAAVDRDLETICLKCLEKESPGRYASATELADDLQRYLDRRPIHARPISRATRTARWCRRNPRVAILSGALLVALLGGLAGTSLALVQADKRRREADDNASAAREQTQLALSTLKSVIFDIQGGLKNLPGAGEVRRKLLNTALARLQEVSDKFVAQAAIDRNSGVALRELGDVFLRLGTDDAGQPLPRDKSGSSPAAQRTATDMARELYERSLEIAVNLAAANRHDAEAQRDLSVSYSRLGNVGLHGGDLPEAMRYYELSLEIGEKLAAADPSNAQAQRDLAISYKKLGDASLRARGPAEAERYYKLSLEVGEKLTAADASDAQTQRDFFPYDRLGNVSLQMGHVKEAFSYYQRGLEIHQKLAAADPRDAHAQRDLSVSYEKLGDVSLREGDLAEAVRYYKLGLEIGQKLAVADPRDAQAQRDLAGSYEKLGNVSLKAGEVEEALSYYQQSLEICQKLAAADPQDAQAQRSLSVAHNGLGDASLKAGREHEALSHYKQGLELRQKPADPRDAQAQHDLSVSYDRLGDASLEAGQVQEALSYYKKGLQISEMLAAADPRDSQARRDLGVSYSKLGDASLEVGDVMEAARYFQLALDSMQKLATADPHDVQAQRDLSVSYNKRGDVSLQAGQVQEALSYYRQGLAIRQKLAAADPADAQAQRDLMVSRYNIGMAERQRFEYAAAIEQFESGAATLHALIKEGRLVQSSRSELESLQQEITYCRAAQIATGGMELLLKQPAPRVPELLGVRIQELARKGDAAAVVAAAHELSEFSPKAAENSYNAACGYCLAALIIMEPPHGGVLSRTPAPRKRSPEDQAPYQQNVDRAVAALRAAVAMGYRDAEHLQKDPDLNPLHNHPEYGKLLEELTVKSGVAKPKQNANE